ncbi:U6 snRNA phosphodiesterase 1 [Stomoxys calcitrans]|uniref:U6 snRNA phosphodiesterase 1 n=1 Tax=Stomoxys calcitrans TaxID=35570 RepID=UPI0027E3A9C9|nr:U6 snRNA phosphodiesterase 1 [Stomoxys calcitrans]
MLVDYSSSSDSETEDDKKSSMRQKMETNLETQTSILPKATTLLGKRKLYSCEDPLADDSSLHQGRIRSFKHERGNWATYVFIGVPLYILEDVQDVCLTHFKDIYDIKSTPDLHISLSKTVVLQYHFIESFVKSLEEIITPISSLTVSLNKLKVYTNAERTRTFLAVKVDDIHLKQMFDILHKVDNVMLNFKLPEFYEDPSFHISILWCVGDHANGMNERLAELMAILKDHFPIELRIDKIYCKSGFKEFSFQLK